MVKGSLLDENVLDENVLDKNVLNERKTYILTSDDLVTWSYLLIHLNGGSYRILYYIITY